VARARISALVISHATEQKLLHKHKITIDELEDAVVDVVGLKLVWDDHPERGRRLLVESSIRKRRVIVVLYPTEVADEWNLGSAYFV